LAARSTLDLGGRFRFEVGRLPATLRVQVQNVFNSIANEVTYSGGFSPGTPRGVMAYLTVEGGW